MMTTGWLHEEGIGEHRAVLIEGGVIVEALIECRARMARRNRPGKVVKVSSPVGAASFGLKAGRRPCSLRSRPA